MHGSMTDDMGKYTCFVLAAIFLILSDACSEQGHVSLHIQYVDLQGRCGKTQNHVLFGPVGLCMGVRS